MGGVQLLQRRAHAQADCFARDGAQRPPWSTESRIRDACTSCKKCIDACPEAILRAGPAGTPVVDFLTGACTFCAACAEACPEPVFDLQSDPWPLIAEVQPSCLLHAGVSCRSCTDACAAAALRFDVRGGGVGRIRVDADACTGCGACAGMCPVGAIAFVDRKTAPEDVE